MYYSLIALQWPWMVSIGKFDIRNGNYTHLCGATLVSKKHILTAAHCLDDIPLESLSIILGTDDLEDTSQRYRVEPDIIQKFVHPDYDKQYAYYDVAILEIAPEVEFTNGVSPVCLPEVAQADEDFRAGEHVTLTGWGKLKRVDDETSPQLRKTQLSIFGQTHCNSSHNLASSFLGQVIKDDLPNLFQPNLLCAGYEVCLCLVYCLFLFLVYICLMLQAGNQGSCPGDSGGPLVKFETLTDNPYHLQLAIVHGGVNKCGDVNFPGIYVRLEDEAILDFVHRTVFGRGLGVVRKYYLCYEKNNSFHSGMKIFGFWSEKSEFPALEKCLPYFYNPDIEENRYCRSIIWR
jgi:secreted trypsin-like serine protease